MNDLIPSFFGGKRRSGCGAGAALRALTCRERCAPLAAAVKVLQANRDAHHEITTARALNFCHRRSAVQASTAVLAAL